MNKNIEKGEISIRYNLGRDRLFWKIGNENNPDFLRVFLKYGLDMNEKVHDTAL